MAQLRSDLNANKTVYEVGASTRSLTFYLDTASEAQRVSVNVCESRRLRSRRTSSRWGTGL